MKVLKRIICMMLICSTVSAQNNVCLNNQTTVPGNKYYTAGDFNNDNALDFVTTAFSGTVFGIVLSNGPQSFASPSTYTFAGPPAYATAADFNNDGNDDLAISCPDSNRVAILNGNGAGSFTSTTNYTLSNWAGFIASADLNNDGFKDIAVGSGTNNIYVFKNNGSGGFTSSQYAFSVQNILLEDLNNDGFKDMYNIDYSGNAYFLKNSGNGTYVFQSTTGLNVNCVFDLNNDGKKDLFSWNSYSLQVSLGTGNFNFAAPTIISSPFQNTGSVTKGDLNSDGLLDISFYNMNAASFEVATRLNNGSGGFLAPVIYSNSAWAFQMETIESLDADGNGKADIVIYSDNAPRLTIIYNCSVAGINNNNISDPLIDLFPNPSSGFYKINSVLDLKAIEVQDLNGKLILRTKHTDTIDLRDHPNGIYFLKIETVDGEVGNYKLIKTN